jgi:hypothetical protein
MEHEGGAEKRGQRHDITRHVIRQAGVDQRIDRERAGVADEQRVAIGRGLANLVEGHDAGGTGLVVDHHRLLPAPLQRLAKRARHHVGPDAHRVRHDDTHAAHREQRIARAQRGGGGGKRQRGQQSAAGDDGHGRGSPEQHGMRIAQG